MIAQKCWKFSVHKCICTTQKTLKFSKKSQTEISWSFHTLSFCSCSSEISWLCLGYCILEKTEVSNGPWRYPYPELLRREERSLWIWNPGNRFFACSYCSCLCAGHQWPAKVTPITSAPLGCTPIQSPALQHGWACPNQSSPLKRILRSVSSSAQAAITEDHTSGGLSTRESYSSQFWRLEDHNQVSAWSGEGNFPGSRGPTSHHVLTWRKG